MATTPNHAIPYPLPTAAVMNGAADMQGIAERLDAIMLAEDEIRAAATRLLATKLASADAQPAFRILGSGRMEWGPGGSTAPDTVLYRGTVNHLQTDGNLSVGSGIRATTMLRIFDSFSDVNPRMRLDVDSIEFSPNGSTAADTTLVRIGSGVLGVGAVGQSGQLHFAWGAVPGSTQIGGRVEGDSEQRWRILANGTFLMGPGGSTPPDVNLYRSTANVLASDDKIDPASLNVQVKAGAPVDADIVGGAASGDCVLDTTNSRIYFRVGTTWKYATLT